MNIAIIGAGFTGYLREYDVKEKPSSLVSQV
jgi:hypothetical protein